MLEKSHSPRAIGVNKPRKMTEHHPLAFEIFRSSETSSRGRRNVLEKGDRPKIYHPGYRILGDIPEKYIPKFNIRRSPIEFSIELADLFKKFVIENFDKELYELRAPDYLPDDIGFEILRFTISLKAYYESNKDRYPMKLETLIQGISDINFASKLKAYKTECFLRSVSGQTLDQSQPKHDFPEKSITDIGEIFNYNYWIFWKEEDPVDYLEGLTQENPIEPELLEKFKEHLYNMLPEFIQPVQEEEILLKQSKSSCIRPDGSKTRVYKEKQVRNSFSNEPLKGKRCIIRIGPDNTRDSIMLTVPQSNTVKLFEEQLSLICQIIPGSTHLKDPSEFKKSLDRFYDEYDFFYDRDITKEGITKPRQLIMAIIDVLYSKYPYLPCMKYKDIYSAYYLIVDNEEINMPRGHGLGMGNSLTTIMQATINSLIQEIYYNENESPGPIGFLTWNDDYSAGFKSVEDLENYSEIDHEICKKLQIITKDKKTHKIYEKAFVFCEHYYPSYFNRKESYKLTEIYNTFALGNILNAKEYFAMITSKLNPEDSLLILEKLVKRFGYEFYPDEWKEPYIFGGWLNPSMNQVRLDLYDIEITREKYRAYLALKAPFKLHLKKRKKIDKVYISPLIQIYGENLTFPDFFRKRLHYMENQQDVDYLYMFYKNDSLYNKFIEKLYYFRQNIYKKFIDNLPEKSEIFQDLLERYPLTDFLPPKENIVEENYIQGENKEKIPHCIPNETLSMIKFFNPDKVNDYVIPYLRQFIGRDRFKFEILSLTEKYADSIFPLIDLRYQDCQINFERYDVIRLKSDNYNIDPDRVASTWETLTGNNKFPIIYPSIKGREQFISEEDDKIYQILCSSNAQKLLNYIEVIGFNKTREILHLIELLPEVQIDLEYYKYKYNIRDLNKEEELTSEKREFSTFEDFGKWLEKPIPRPVDDGITRLFDEAVQENEGRLSMNMHIQSNPDYKTMEGVPMNEIHSQLFKLLSWKSNDYQQKGLYQIFFPDEEISDEEEFVFSLYD